MNDHPTSKPTAVIAGAGPAGLTAALELLRSSSVFPIVFEAGAQVGGISKTIVHHGNRMDLGGHRFFSKSDWVMRWWQEILPVSRSECAGDEPLRLSYQRQSHVLTPSPQVSTRDDRVMLVRERLSRILYRRRFFDYPLKVNADTLRNIGVREVLRIGGSYASARCFPRSPEHSLEDFLVNRFGDRLFRTFFKEYTEKVWGVPCAEISAEWGAQRIKTLSVTKALRHALSAPFRSSVDTGQKTTETSLIERFLYPKYGPGQMWEEVARKVQRAGGEIHVGWCVVGLEHEDWKVTAALVRDTEGHVERVPCSHFISSLPVRDLISMLNPDERALARIAAGLPYRDLMSIGLLVRRMLPIPGSRHGNGPNGMPPDNWIYIQEPDVKIGRLQIFNNWSPALVADPNTIWLGLEYFCARGDDLWGMREGTFHEFASEELERIGLIDRRDVLDATLVRVPDAYPAYFGDYRDFAAIRRYLDCFSNLYPVGRNGMHRYNNQDHSMLAARAAVDAIMNRGEGKSAIWQVNAEEDYHEEMGRVAVNRFT